MQNVEFALVPTLQILNSQQALAAATLAFVNQILACKRWQL
jgi:hypothetical protein